MRRQPRLTGANFRVDLSASTESWALVFSSRSHALPVARKRFSSKVPMDLIGSPEWRQHFGDHKRSLDTRGACDRVDRAFVGAFRDSVEEIVVATEEVQFRYLSMRTAAIGRYRTMPPAFGGSDHRATYGIAPPFSPSSITLGSRRQPGPGIVVR